MESHIPAQISPCYQNKLKYLCFARQSHCKHILHLLNDAMLLLGPCWPGESLEHEWWGRVNVTGILLSVCCMETGTSILVTSAGYAMQIPLQLTGISLLRKINFKVLPWENCSYHNLAQIFNVQKKIDYCNTRFSHDFNEDQCCLKPKLYVSIAHIFVSWDM